MPPPFRGGAVPAPIGGYKKQIVDLFFISPGLIVAYYK